MNKIFAVIGGSGSGKSRLSHALADSIQNMSLIGLDNYYLPDDQQTKDQNGYYNYDLPESVDHLQFVEDLKRLQSGETLVLKEYTFEHKDRKAPKKIIIQPNDYLLIESLFLLHVPEIRDLIDFSIFVKADNETCLQRRLIRDVQERGDTPEKIEYRWEHHIKPSYKTYIEPYLNHVDLVVDGNGTPENAYKEALEGLQRSYKGLIMNKT